MTSFLLKKSFHLNLCQSLVDDVQFQRSNYYYFLGRIAKWSDSDTTPVDIYDNTGSENSTRSEIISIKKVLPSDVSCVTRRIDWKYGKVFDRYDSLIDITQKDFYVLTDTFDVYKCLDNYRGGQSLVKPTGTSLTPFRTNDGYMWKYMYTIPKYKQNKFLTELKMPVQRAISDRFYNLGGIDGGIITNAGTGYEVTASSISISGGTSGSGATIDVTVSAGQVSSIEIISGGSGYTHGCKITLIDTSGYGANITPVIIDGVLVNTIISNQGTGYSSAVVGLVSVGGAVAVPSISRETGSLIKINIIESGIGYSTPPEISLNSLSGSGKYSENEYAVLKAIVSDGKLVNISIEDPGINYAYQTSPTISIIGDGVGAKLAPVVDYYGKIIDVVVESKGTGYTYALGQIYGTGSGAELKILLSESDFVSDQSSVEQTSIDGAIYNIVMTDFGSGYTTANIEISGDGNGAKAVPVLSDGRIIGINITNPGSGYTTATVNISGDNILSNPLAVNAAAYAIISPVGGHGSDAVRELYSDSICIFSDIRSESPNSFDQDFREYGVIKDMRDLYTGNTISKILGSCTYTIEVDTVVGLVPDELLFIGSSQYRVVSINADLLRVIISATTKNQLSSLVTLTAVDNLSRQYNITAIIKTPDANKYTGQMLFVSNSDAFTFSDEQEINIKTFLTL